MQLSTLRPLAHPLHAPPNTYASRLPAPLHAPALSSTAQYEGESGGRECIAVMHATHVTVKSSESWLGRPLQSTFTDANIRVPDGWMEMAELASPPPSQRCRPEEAARIAHGLEDVPVTVQPALAATSARISPRGLVVGSADISAAVIVTDNRGGGRIYIQSADELQHEWTMRLDMGAVLHRGYIAARWGTLVPFDTTVARSSNSTEPPGTILELNRRRQLVSIECAAWSGTMQPHGQTPFVLLALGSRAGVVSVWKMPLPLADVSTDKPAAATSATAAVELLYAFTPSEVPRTLITQLAFSPMYFDATRGATVCALAVGTSAGQAYVYGVQVAQSKGESGAAAASHSAAASSIPAAAAAAAAAPAASIPFPLLASLRVGTQLMSVSALSWSQVISGPADAAASNLCSFCVGTQCAHRAQLPSDLNVHHMLAIGCYGQIHVHTLHPDCYMHVQRSVAIARGRAGASSAAAAAAATATPSHPALCHSFSKSRAHNSGINSFVWLIQATSTLHPDPDPADPSHSAPHCPALARQHIQLLSSSNDAVVHRWIVKDDIGGVAGKGALLQLDSNSLVDLAGFDPAAAVDAEAASPASSSPSTGLVVFPSTERLYGAFGLLRSSDGLLLYSLESFIAGGTGGMGMGHLVSNPALDRKRGRICMLRSYTTPQVDLMDEAREEVARLAVDYSRIQVDEVEDQPLIDLGGGGEEADHTMDASASASVSHPSPLKAKIEKVTPVRRKRASAGGEENDDDAAAASPPPSSSPAAAAAAAAASGRSLIEIMEADERADRAAQAAAGAAAANKRGRRGRGVAAAAAATAGEYLAMKMEMDGQEDDAAAAAAAALPEPAPSPEELTAMLADPSSKPLKPLSAKAQKLADQKKKKEEKQKQKQQQQKKKKSKKPKKRKKFGELSSEEGSDDESDDDEWKGGGSAASDSSGDDASDSGSEAEVESSDTEASDANEAEVRPATKATPLRTFAAVGSKRKRGGRPGRGAKGLGVASSVPIPVPVQDADLATNRMHTQLSLVMHKVLPMWMDRVEQQVRALLVARGQAALSGAAAGGAAALVVPSSLSFFSLQTFFLCLFNPLHLSLPPVLSSVPTQVELSRSDMNGGGGRKKGGGASATNGVMNPFTSFSLWWRLLPGILPADAIAGGFSQIFRDESQSPDALSGRTSASEDLPPLFPIDAFAMPMHRQLPFIFGPDVLLAAAEGIIEAACPAPHKSLDMLWLEPLPSMGKLNAASVADALQPRLALLLLTVALAARSPYVALQLGDRLRAEALQQRMLRTLHLQFIRARVQKLATPLNSSDASVRDTAVSRVLSTRPLAPLLLQTDWLTTALLQDGGAALSHPQALPLVRTLRAVYAVCAQSCVLEYGWFEMALPTAQASSGDDAATIAGLRALSASWSPQSREVCPLCEAPVPLTSSLTATCGSAHTLPRCRRTLMILGGGENTVACHVCNGAALREHTSEAPAGAAASGASSTSEQFELEVCTLCAAHTLSLAS